MVIEELEVDVDVDDVKAFASRDDAVWTAFLRTCPGFLRKELWRPVDRPGVLVIQIWWASREQWEAISDDQVAAVDAQMGEWFRAPRCREYELIEPQPRSSPPVAS